MPSTSTGTLRKSSTRKTSASARMDAIKLLKQDHREVESLFESFEKARSDSQKEKLATQICQMLKVHTTIEEEIFYPAVRKALDEPDLMKEAEIEHESAKTLIRHLKRMKPSDAAYVPTFTVLCEYVLHHVKEEEGEIFPKAQRRRVNLQALGKKLADRRVRLLRR